MSVALGSDVVIAAVVNIVAFTVVVAVVVTLVFDVVPVLDGGSGIVGSERILAVEVAQSASTILQTKALPPVAGDRRRVPFLIVAARRSALGGDADEARSLQ